MAWIETAGGIALPSPAFGSGKVTISTLVDGGRNAEGNFIGSVVGDDKLKIECAFPALRPDEMMRLLQVFDRKRGGRFINTFRVFDPRVNGFVYLDMYVGDRSGKPYLVNKDTMRPTYWTEVQANLIQV
jgi:hypothetical protein